MYLSAALALLALSALAAPATASADVVFERAGALWVMDDDGSNERLLLDGARSDLRRLARPHVSADGATVVFEAGTAPGDDDATRPCPFGCTGAYALRRGGGVARVSPADPTCAGCATFAFAPEVAADGRVAYGTVTQTDGITSSRALSVTNAGGASAPWETPTGCDDAEAPPRDLALNPTNPGLGAYAGCTDLDGDELLWIGGSTEDSQQELAVFASIDDPSFSPDAQRIVLVAGRRQLAEVTAAAGAGGATLLSAPPGTLLRSPRYAGARIVFEAETRDPEARDIWSIPEGCRGCTFPKDARRLTEDGLSGAPAWTAALAIAPVAAAAAATPAVAAKAAAPAAGSKLVAPKLLRGAALVARRLVPGAPLAVRLTLSARSWVTIGVARMLPRGKLRALGSLRVRLYAGRSTVELRTIRGKPLAPGRYRLLVEASGERAALVATVYRPAKKPPK